MFADGSRLEDGATDFAVVWKNGQSWVCTYSQEAYDVERVAIFRTPRLPSDGWLRTSPAPAGNMRYGRLDQASSRFGGARHTRESSATRRPTSGQRLR
jgi:hypothetical protein